jgi:mannosyltransferase
MWFGGVFYAMLAWALIAVCVVAWVVGARRTRAAGAALPTGASASTSSMPRLEPLAIAWLVVPMGTLIALSPFVSGFTARYGTFSAPAAAVLMAFGVRAVASWVGRRWSVVVAGVLALAIVAAAAPLWASQRTPYAKNGSDWNVIASVIKAQAVPGDGIVFDQNDHPSRRPRLAMNTDPAAFGAVRDVTLKTPYAQAPLWFDEVFTVSQAASLGRLDGVTRVWVVEYRDRSVVGSPVDDWGITELRHLGYTREKTITDHSSVIYLYVRP